MKMITTPTPFHYDRMILKRLGKVGAVSPAVVSELRFGQCVPISEGAAGRRLSAPKLERQIDRTPAWQWFTLFIGERLTLSFEERPSQSRVKDGLKGTNMQTKNDAFLKALDNRIAATHRYGELRGKPGEAEAYDDMRRADREFEEIAART